MRVACYYTNASYKALAEKMMASARGFGLPTVGYEKPNPSGSWKAGDCLKPDVVLEAMCDHPTESILFVDADCRFMAAPEILEERTHDSEMAVYFSAPGLPYSTVTWFRAGSGGRRYAERWVEMMKKFPDRPNDIVALKLAIDSIRPNRVMHLPPAYCWTEPWMRKRFGAVRPVVEHYAVGEHSFEGNVYERTKDTLYRG